MTQIHVDSQFVWFVYQRIYFYIFLNIYLYIYIWFVYQRIFPYNSYLILWGY